MTEKNPGKSEAERDLDELYKDGRTPTLKELQEVTRKHGLKLVNVESSDEDEKPPQGGAQAEEGSTE